jgi:hypothetical protein
MTLIEGTHSMRSAARESLFALLIFATGGAGLGLCLSSMWAPNGSLSFVCIASMAAGISGGCAWWVLCGRRATYSVRRCVLCGVVTGLICHPVFWSAWIIFSIADSTFRGKPSEMAVTGSALLLANCASLYFYGLFTVCAGVIAAAACRYILSKSRRASL